MRQSSLVLCVLLIASACTRVSQETTTTPTTAPPTTTTTVPTTTTTTLDPVDVAAATCDSLKVAVFDLDAAIRAGLDALPIGQAEDLSDEAVGQVVVEAMVGFYDALESIAEEAPSDVARALLVASTAVEPWRTAMTEGFSEDTFESLDPASLSSPEVVEASAEVQTWTDEWCGTQIAVDPETVMFTTVFASMLGTLGTLFGSIDDIFGEEPPISPAATALAYGDDATFDDLYERCGTGDGQACQDLYFSAFGEYELWGQTCGASIPLRSAYLVDCTGKFGDAATTYGDDFVLDTLWDECEAGEPESCDALFAAAPFGSDYEQFGGSCAEARQGDFSTPCTFVASAEPFGYGDDPTFDQLWDNCSVGDVTACDDLFFQTPIGSAYEAFGRVCGDLAEVARSCENAAAWLGGPVG